MNVDLTEEELDLLHDAIASEVARCLVAGIHENPKANARFDMYVNLGIKLGMEL